MGIISKPLGWIIKICYDLVDNYAIALLLFALIMQIILLPLGIKQQKNSVKQAKMRPKEMAIRKKYQGRNDKETQQKMQNEILEMYQKENYSPMAGCLPLLIQLPILFALFNVVTQPLTYICGYEKAEIYNFAVEIVEQNCQVDLSSKEAVDALTEEQRTAIKEFNSEHKYLIWDDKNNTLVTEDDFRLSSNEIMFISDMKNSLNNPENVNAFPYEEDGKTEYVTKEDLPNFSLAGDFMDLSHTPSFKDFNTEKGWLLLIPLFTAIFTYGSQFITKKFTYQSTLQESQDAGCSMKMMQYTMPLLSIWISFQMAAAIGLYWIYRNILATVQTVALYKLIPVPKFTEEDYKAAEKELKGKGGNSNNRSSSNGNKNKVRSLHRIDEDDDEIPENTANNNKSNNKKLELREEADVSNAPKLKDESDRAVKKKAEEETKENEEKSE